MLNGNVSVHTIYSNLDRGKIHQLAEKTAKTNASFGITLPYYLASPNYQVSPPPPSSSSRSATNTGTSTGNSAVVDAANSNSCVSKSSSSGGADRRSAEQVVTKSSIYSNTTTSPLPTICKRKLIMLYF